MTTGRINQVTTVGPGGPAPGASPRGRTPRGGPGQLRDRGGPWGQHPARGRAPERRRSTEVPRAIQLAPLSSPRDGPPQRLTLDPRGPCPGETAACAPQEEDAVRRSHPEAAIGLGLPPNVLRIMFAIGQPSTDSVRARRHETCGSSGADATSAFKPRGAIQDGRRTDGRPPTLIEAAWRLAQA